jgi:hypothetical protein
MTIMHRQHLNQNQANDNKAKLNTTKHKRGSQKQLTEARPRIRIARRGIGTQPHNSSMGRGQLLAKQKQDIIAHKASNRGHKARPRFTGTERYQCTKG